MRANGLRSASVRLERVRTFGVSAVFHLAIGVAIALLVRERVLQRPGSEPVEFEFFVPEPPPPEVATPSPPPASEPIAIPTTERPAIVPKKVSMRRVDTALPFQPDAPDEPGEREAPEGAEAIPAPVGRYTFNMTDTVGGSGAGGAGEGYVSSALGGGGSFEVSAGGGGSGGAGPVANQGARGVKVARDWQITRMPDPTNDRDFEPTYPPVAKREGREAVVTVQLDIDSAGLVVAAVIVGGPRGHGFRKSALAYATKLRFEPARAGERAVASRIEWTVHFYVRN